MTMGILTYDDIVTDTCTCIGTPYECANLLLNIGDNCDDGNPLTYKDKVTENCECIGKFYSCPDLLSNIGYACDDGNPNTIMDHLSDSCVCIGYCPELFTYTSFSCNDGNPSTINDIVSFDCICGGQVVGINEINDGSIFNISPNPAQDRISIEWRGAPPTVAYIYNIKQQLQSRITLQSGEQQPRCKRLAVGVVLCKSRRRHRYQIQHCALSSDKQFVKL
ncbi:MAG: hypothetical protein IPL35_12165 [Sphingobacteriales bacterium]|nr:hypothetical protein [Sphingobacteriales bacterium]